MHDHSLADFDPAVIAPRLEEVALILACSRFVADEIRRLYPAAAARCHELYNGVDERFLEVTAAPAASQNVLFVGRLCPEKGVHVLLAAMSQVLQAHPRASLGLVGPLDVAPKDFVDPAAWPMRTSAPTTHVPASSSSLRSGTSHSVFR